MKLIVFTMLVCVLATNAKEDSIARFKKPVARFLISEHYRAERMTEKVNEREQQISELKLREKEYIKQIESYRKDSLMCDSLVGLEQKTSQVHEEAYVAEKNAHRKTKKKLIGTWIGVGAVVVVRVVFLFVKQDD